VRLHRGSSELDRLRQPSSSRSPCHAPRTLTPRSDPKRPDTTLAAWDADHDQQQPLTADDIATALDHAGTLAALLADAERETRARLYRTLDLVLQLDPVQETLDVRLQLCGGGQDLNLRPSGYERSEPRPAGVVKYRSVALSRDFS
ncbi:MAG: hypothetical protein AB7V15_06365, partial [Acidimicrobiia bacterium]